MPPFSWLCFCGKAKRPENTPLEHVGGNIIEDGATAKPDPHGLHNLYPPEDPENPYGPIQMKTNIDIVAVHGLDGDPWDTWTGSSGFNWLKDFLPKVLPNARVMTFGYNSSTKFSNSVSTIEDFARELLHRIRLVHQNRQTDMGRPLIFVCHSLGGIIVKKALILAHEAEDSFGFIKKSCRGIVFLGTPHRGSNVADLASVLSTMVNSLSLSQAIRTTLINDLRSHSGVLQSISEQSVQRLKGLEVISFYERVTMGAGLLSTLVVDKASATLNIPNEEPVPINADHRTMCKFSYEGCPKYALVQGEIVRMVNKVLNPRQGVVGIPQESELHEKILRWLNPESTESPRTYEDKLEQREDGTCSWFWEHSDVKNWCSAGSRIFWVYGPPGVGKSVLCSSIISKLDDEGKIVAYFFCVPNQLSEPDPGPTPAPKLNSPEFILRNLTVQLLEKDSSCHVPHELRELYNHYNRRKSSLISLVSLRKILHSLLNIHPRTYIIIDGLDEMDELDQDKHDQLKRLLKILDLGLSGTVKWLLVSQKTRAVDENLANFKDSPNYLELDLAEVDQDLRNEIKSMIKTAMKGKFSDPPTELESSILESLVHLTGGNFLCAKLLLDDIKDCPSLDSLIESIENYRPGLENNYLRALRKMASVKNPSWTKAAERTLVLVSLALKPLTIFEVQAALSVSVSGVQSGIPGMFSNEIEKLCLPLVRVCPKKKTMNLVHHSVKEFLMKRLQNPEEWDITGIENFFIHEEKGNTTMAFVCLSYLSKDHYSSFSPIGGDYLPTENLQQIATMATTFDAECETQRSRFMKYAAIFWHSHADKAEVTQDLANAVMRFLKSPNFITCLRVRSLYAPYHFGTFISGNGLLIAFADTIPGWLQSTRPFPGTENEGKEMAFQYFSFIKEWGHVLGRYPGEIERCLIGTLGSIFFSQIEKITDAHLLDESRMIESADVDALNFTSIADLHDTGRILTLRAKSGTRDAGGGRPGSTQLGCIQSGTSKSGYTLSKSTPYGSIQSLEFWYYHRGIKPAPQLRWSLPDVVGFTSGQSQSRFENFNCCNNPHVQKAKVRMEWPSNMSPLLASPALDYAILNGHLFRLCESKSVGLQKSLLEFKFPSILCVPLGMGLGTHGKYLAIGATWECEGCAPDDDEFGDGISEGSDSDNEESSGVDSDVGGDSPVFAGTCFASVSPATSYAYFKLLVYDCTKPELVLLHGFNGHCRINDGGYPFHYASPVFHPKCSLVAWAPDSGEIIVANFKTGGYGRQCTDRISRNSRVIARELHFSRLGELLYEIKITVKTTEHASFHRGKIFLTTYPVKDTDLSGPHRNIQHFDWKLRYSCAQTLGFTTPTITWTTGSVYVSFSNMGLSVCRIDLLPKRAKLYAARTTMTLPASAIQRPVHFIPVGEKDALLALGGSVGFGPSLISAKDLLYWEEREWVSEINFTVLGGRDAGVFYEVDEPSFIVPVRSGAVWTDRQILRCS